MVRIYYSLYDRMLTETRLLQAFQKVKANKGKPGIDGQTVEDFADRAPEELALLVRELKDKSYRPQPVRRVEIRKEGGGIRELGIPTVRDRVVQQASAGDTAADLRPGVSFRPATATGPAGVAIRPSPKPRCSFGDTSANGSWTWICRNASTLLTTT